MDDEDEFAPKRQVKISLPILKFMQNPVESEPEKPVRRANSNRNTDDAKMHQQGIDTTTPAGKAMFQMMGVFAEFERAMIQERVKAGLARAAAEGKFPGKPRVSADREQAIRDLLAQGVGIIKTAKTVGCGVSVVQRVRAEQGNNVGHA